MFLYLPATIYVFIKRTLGKMYFSLPSMDIQKVLFENAQNFIVHMGQVFKNGRRKICGRQPKQTISSRPYHFNFFKGCLFHKFYLVHSWNPWSIYSLCKIVEPEWKITLLAMKSSNQTSISKYIVNSSLKYMENWKTNLSTWRFWNGLK